MKHNEQERSKRHVWNKHYFATHPTSRTRWGQLVSAQKFKDQELRHLVSDLFTWQKSMAHTCHQKKPLFKPIFGTEISLRIFFAVYVSLNELEATVCKLNLFKRRGNSWEILTVYIWRLQLLQLGWIPCAWCTVDGGKLALWFCLTILILDPTGHWEWVMGEFWPFDVFLLAFQIDWSFFIWC